MSIHKLDTKIYVGQKAFINKEGKLLVLRDAEEDKGLDFPGGKYRWGENIEDELRREVIEETGLEIEIGKPFITWTAEHAGGKVKVFLIGYLCEYKSGEITLSEEHNKFEWIDKNGIDRWKEETKYFEALEEYFRVVKGA